MQVLEDLFGDETGGTRGVVVLNESLQRLMVLYTQQNSGGNIYFKTSPLGSISFSSRGTMLSGSLNNVSTTRQNVSGDVVIVAGDSSDDLHGIRYAWGGSSSTSATFASTAFRYSASPISGLQLSDADQNEEADVLAELVSL